MSGYIQGSQVYNSRDKERKSIFTELMSIVKELQTKYGGKTELATETDLRLVFFSPMTIKNFKIFFPE